MTKRWRICNDCGTHHTAGAPCPYCNHWRGHPIYVKDGEHYYADTNEPTVGNRRPCGHCGKEDTPDEHDGCISNLPGVMNACCGHGRINSAYVQLIGGKVLAGKEALDFFKT